MVKTRPLKVYQAPFGFYDSVVAASSQAAALRAWGSHQNLFAEGLAHLTSDEDAVKAALSHPEIPLRRAIGSNDPFELEPRKGPDLPITKSKPLIPKGKAESKSLKAKVGKPAPVDRSKLDAAEKALGKLEDDRKNELAEFSRQREAIDRDENTAQKSYLQAKKAALAVIETARRDFIKASGKVR